MKLIKDIKSGEELKQEFEKKGFNIVFSSDGFDCLFDYLNCFESDRELDILSICWDFTEYESKQPLIEKFNDVEFIEKFKKLPNGHYLVLEHTRRFE